VSAEAAAPISEDGDVEMIVKGSESQIHRKGEDYVKLLIIMAVKATQR
jgi:hypothetical protein